MTVPSTPRAAGPFIGNGATTVFPFTFKVFAAGNIAAVHTDTYGVDTPLVLGSDYSVTLNPDQASSPGGSITYPLAGAPMPSGAALVIVGALPYDQPYSPTPGGKFAPASVENAFDRATIQIQQLAEVQSRTFTFPPSGGAIPTFPPVAERANRLLGFDAAGNFIGVLPGATDAIALAADLADSGSPTKGAGLSGFDGRLNYAADTLGRAVQMYGILPEWFGALGDGVTDDTAAIAAAIAFAAALSGPQHSDSMGQAPYGYGISRRLKLSGRKYLINSTITLGGDVSIEAEGGGFLAGAGFAAGAYMLDTGANPYGGRVNDLTLDGGDRNVKGVRIQNAHLTRWRGLSVVSCRNDGIVYEAGAEFVLTDFEVSGSATPQAPTVAGLRVLGSDAHFTSGVVKYTPIGVALKDGGNNTLTGIHCWGLYAAFKQYLSFWSVNSVRNTFVGCYADSPAKQDYAQDNLAVLNGIPNGGVGFYLDATSAQNQIVGCRGYVSTGAYSAAGLPGSDQFWLIYCAASFTQVTGLVYNYAGNWLGDVRFDSQATRDTALLLGRPGSANGLAAGVMVNSRDAAGGSVDFTVQNVSNSYATSAAATRYLLGNAETARSGAVYGPSGASYFFTALNGAERLRIDGTKLSYFGTNSAEGDLAAVFSDGVGSYAMMSLHRSNGGAVPNAAFAAAKFGSINSNSRSINAAGTVNASGADYAEYMTKAPGCGAIAKGQIVGVDADGRLTDRWAAAVTYVTKSTDPSYVGGDNWGWGLEGAELEAARQTVDRIAFCGQVPVNVVGASAGDYIVPVEDGDGIAGAAVKCPTFEQYRAAVGKVVAIDADGRARIVVKVA